MTRMLPPMPQNSVVVASEIWPSLSFHSRALHCEKSRTRFSSWRGIGCSGASVRGMYRLNSAATKYSSMMAAMALSAGVSMPVSIIGRSSPSMKPDTCRPTSCPPSTMPRITDRMVRPSIQPFALTSCDGGSSSVRMPYLAGE